MFDRAFTSLSEIVGGHGRYRWKRLAVVDPVRRLSWRDLDAEAGRIANTLIDLGVRPDDTVVLITSSDARTIAFILGILRARGVVVPLSTMLGADALGAMIADCDAAFVVADQACAALAGASADAAKLPADRRLALDFTAPGWRGLESLLVEASSENPDLQIEAADRCNIIYSSGTTGTPKGIVHAHAIRMGGATSLAIAFRIDGTAVTLLATPLYTNGTWMTLLPTLVTGGTVVASPKFSAREFIDTVSAERVTHVFLVPTQIRAVLDALRPDDDLSSLRLVISAGSLLPAPWKREAIEKLGGRLLELYGLTEGVGTVLMPEDMAEKQDSVGAPLPGTELRIISDDGAELPPGQLGEIVGRSGGLMLGYHNRPQDTAEAIWRDRRNRTFFKTGDMGTLDEDGFLYLVDRKKDMIVTGGVNVFAADVERVFHQHPHVKDVAVIGAADPKWIETPVAIVIPIEEAQTDAHALAQWANARLGKHQRVSRVILRTEDFPRNALGKVIKRDLRKQLRSEALA